MKKLQRGWVACLAALATLGLGACGGGGDDDAPATRTPLATVSQDIAPPGARLDLKASNYFPAAPGDSWTYDHRPNGIPAAQTLTRSVSAGAGMDVVITETLLGETASQAYRRTAEGIEAVLPMADALPEAASRFVGDLLMYPEPFHAAGSTRRVIRQGSLGLDLDGDGVGESFRLEMTQVFVGFETVTLPKATLQDAARFRNVTAFTLQPSNPAVPVIVATGTEEAWWAPGIGLVRAEWSFTESTGTIAQTPYTLLLTGAQVGGVQVFAW
jgi:hypothetical protein